jgi:carboxylesterase
MPAVLLIHGFTGSPHDMAYLHEQLADAGFSVSTPRLPGHGTCASDFLQSGWKDWYRGVLEAYLNLRSKYPTVYAAGLSMGGLLTALLARHFEIPRIALAAPAFKLRSDGAGGLIRLTPLVAPFMATSVNKNELKIPSEYTGDRRILEEEYKGKNWIRQGAQLEALRRRAIRELPLVKSSTMVITSRSDETVDLITGPFLQGRMTNAAEFSLHELEKSDHVVTDGVEREIVAREIAGWFSSDTE